MVAEKDRSAEDLLRGLLDRFSPSQGEAAASRYLVEQMTALGAHAYVDSAGNAVGEWGEGSEELLLLGHIDTVPGFIAVRQEGRLLYGRGAVDAKGPLAAFAVAASRARIPPNRRVIVVGAVEEEAATSKGARALLQVRAPAMVVIGEPSGWDRVTVGYKGRLLVDYARRDSVEHTAGPGESACERAVLFWQEVVRHASQHNAAAPDRMFEQLTPSLRAINSCSDGLYEQVEMTIGYRLPLDLPIARLQEHLIQAAGEAQVGFRGYEPAYRASRTSPLARAFLRAIHEGGSHAAFKVKSGTSDMNVVGPVWECPIVAYGPGDSSLDHTPHEHIDLDEYQRAIGVLIAVIENP